MPVPGIMGMAVDVRGFPVEVYVLVDEIHLQQQILVPEYVIGEADRFDMVIFGEDGHGGLEFRNKGQIMGTDQDRFARLAEFKDQLGQKALCPWIETAGWFVEKKNLRIHGKNGAEGDPLFFPPRTACRAACP